MRGNPIATGEGCQNARGVMTEVAELGFDPATLKASYRAERDKRLR